MFNRTTIVERQHTEYVPFEKSVIEKRAPTDDSIRLYEEIKQKAYNSILDTLEVQNNTLNFKAIVAQDWLSYDKKLLYEAEINGTKVKGEVKLHYQDALKDRSEFIRKVYEDLSKNIAAEIVKQLLKERNV